MIPGFAATLGVASDTLLAAGLTSAVTGVAFIVVSGHVARAPVSHGHEAARMAHALWWGALGAYLVQQGVLTGLASLGALTLDAYLATRVVAIPLLLSAIWGLWAYLLFLFTGSMRWAWPAAVAAAAVAGLFFYVTYATPQVLVVQQWLVGLDDSGPLYRLVYALAGLPPILGCVAYLSLLRKESDPVRRHRILLTGLSVLLYVAGGLAARIAAGDLVVFLTLVPLGLLAAVAALLAQFPPRRVRLRTPPPPRPDVDPMLARRLRELL